MHILYREARLESAEPRLTRKTGLSLAAATANASTMYVSYLSNRLNNLQHPVITTGLYNPLITLYEVSIKVYVLMIYMS